MASRRKDKAIRARGTPAPKVTALPARNLMARGKRASRTIRSTATAKTRASRKRLVAARRKRLPTRPTVRKSSEPKFGGRQRSAPRRSIPKRRRPTPSRSRLKIERSKRKNNRTNPNSPATIRSKIRNLIPARRRWPAGQPAAGRPETRWRSGRPAPAGQLRRQERPKRHGQSATAGRQSAIPGQSGRRIEQAQPAAPGRATESRRSRQSKAIATAGQLRR